MEDLQVFIYSDVFRKVPRFLCCNGAKIRDELYRPSSLPLCPVSCGTSARLVSVSERETERGNRSHTLSFGSEHTLAQPRSSINICETTEKKTTKSYLTAKAKRFGRRALQPVQHAPLYSEQLFPLVPKQTCVYDARKHLGTAPNSVSR